ncbi:MAG: ABC transporter permease [Candidatus Omnitrophota bacterium]
MSTFLQDVRFGIRMLVKNRWITLLAVLALTIGIGANSTIFSLVNSIMLSPMPFPHLERMMRVCEIQEGEDVNSTAISGPNYLDLKRQSQSFDSLALVTVNWYNLTGDGEPERISVYMMTAEIFRTTGTLSMTLGRPFSAEEEQPGKERVVLLGYGYWKEHFGGDKDILNRKIFLDGTPYTVLGVLPSEMGFLEGEAKMWLPLPSDRVKENRNNRYYNAVAMLKEGVSLQQARAEIDVISKNLEKEYPEANQKYHLFVEPMIDRLVRLMTQTLIVLHGAVGFVLLLACSIVASLLLARAGIRQKEIAIRTSLGASRFRIIRQILTESVILSCLGGIGGLMLTLWGLDLMVGLLPPGLAPFILRAGIDINVLGFTFAVSILTGLLFGLAPALQTSKTNIVETLNEGGRGSVGRTKSGRILRYLVVSEIALSLILLIGAGLLVNSFARLQHIDIGFDSDNLLTFHLPLTNSKYKEDHQKTAFYRNAIERIEKIPGAESAGVTSILPLTWGTSAVYEIPGRESGDSRDVQTAEIRQINPAYFQAMKISLLKGRFFSPDDENSESRRIIINEFLARRIENGGDPIGKYLTIPDWDSHPYEIVGVVGNVKEYGMTSEFRPAIFTPFLHRPGGSICFAIRTKGDPYKLAPAVRQQIRAIDPDMPIQNLRSMDRLITDTMIMERFRMILVSMVSVVALILSSLGIYGIIAYSVSQRTHEIGVRMALGAQMNDVVRMVVWQGFKLILIGVTIGLAVSFAVTRVLASSLYGIGAADPATYIVISILLGVVSLLACYIPARKAANVDPMIALRCE